LIKAGRKSTQAKPVCHTRQLKVTAGFHEYQLKQAPQERTTIGQILLKGSWLVKAGFSVDSPVKVRVMEGCLVVTAESGLESG